jgi:hypothetical protein
MTVEMEKGYTIKSLLFEIIPEAAVEARGEYPAFSQRDLYYGCRDRYLNHPDRPFHREFMLKRENNETDDHYEARREAARRSRAPIDFKYFTNKVLRDYEERVGEIEGMIREAYGTFVEPHSGDTLELGTLEVADYLLPDHVFDKILVVEKRTERPKFTHDKVAERHDLAIVYSGGYATEALHELLDTARAGDYQIFTWHDADPDGYNIVRNLREATKNMPVAIEVIDLGLTVGQALDLGLAGEPFAEDRKLGEALLSTLNEVELEYFKERKTRFEINSIPSATRIAYVEGLLAENGARPKYVPPDNVLRVRVESDYRAEISRRVEDAIEDIVDKNAIVTEVTEALREEIRLTGAADLIRNRFQEEPATTWHRVVDREHSMRAGQKRAAIEEMVRKTIVTLVAEEIGD